MSHSLDLGKTRFRALVDASVDTSQRLPLVHSTDSYVLADVLSDGVVTPQYCNVFTGEALTYFFYGRPAFRPNLDAEPTGLRHYFPVCLLFKPNWTAKVRRVFPFDSGAFHRGFYRRYLQGKMKLGDFSLEADMSTPGKIVSRFFGSSPAYLLGRPVVMPNIDQSEFEAHSYLALIHAKDSNDLDSRSSGIEVQTAEVIPIGDAVGAIVMPSTFIDGQVGKALRKLSIDILPYRAFERFRPNEYTSTIAELCLNYYVRLGLIDEGDL